MNALRRVLLGGLLVLWASCTPPVGQPQGKPPEPGFSQVVAGGGAGTRLGLQSSMVLDDDGFPIVAYLREDTANGANNQIEVVRWDGAQWRTPVTVAIVGRVDLNAGLQQLWLARDSTDQRLGLAFTKVDQFCVGSNTEEGIFVTFSSDQGATWTAASRVSEERYTNNDDPVNGSAVCDTSSPRLTMAGGVAHLAYHASAGRPAGLLSFSRGIYYSRLPAGGSAWSARELGPELGASSRVSAARLSLALDSAGDPGVAYVARSDGTTADPYQTNVLFWRPGAASAVKVADSNNDQNDTPQVALSFSGLEPRVVYLLSRAGTVYELFAARSINGAAFVETTVPFDNGDRGATYLAAESRGAELIVGYDFAAGAAAAAGSCGGPKIVRSADFTSWSNTCADTLTRQFLGEYLSLKLNAAGELSMVFHKNADDVATPKRFSAGLVYWRQ